MTRLRYVAPLAVLVLFVASLIQSPVMTATSYVPVQSCAEPVASPVLQDSNWTHYPNGNYSTFATMYVEPDVIKVSGTYVMYAREQLNGSALAAIFRGTSLDGVNWNMSKTPVLESGPNGTWDDQLVFSPDVLWNGTGYLMYYVGDGNIAPYPQDFRQIGVAFSADGVHWMKYAHNPVITHGPGVYDARYTRGPSVVYDRGVYKMWYTGTQALNSSSPYFSAIDYANSTDGVHWTKYSGNPVFFGYKFGSGAGAYYQAYWPSVVKVNGSYLMAFSDGIVNIGLARSQDGIHWAFSNSTTPLITSSGWHRAFVGNPSLLLDGDRLLLWFDGAQNSSQSAPQVEGIGFATCGILLSPPPTTTTTTFTTSETTTAVSTSISTSISTSTMPTTVVETVTSTSAASLVGVMTAGVVGFVAALALAIAAILIVVRRRRPPKTGV